MAIKDPFITPIPQVWRLFALLLYLNEARPTNYMWQVRKIQVLYDYQPGQTYGAACPANHIYVVDRYGAGAQTVASFAPSAGANQVATWTGTKSMYDGMRFHYQHACANRIPWLTPNPAGSSRPNKKPASAGALVFGAGDGPAGAERAGFEPAMVLPILAFQASALDHYATSPTGLHASIA